MRSSSPSYDNVIHIAAWHCVKCAGKNDWQVEVGVEHRNLPTQELSLQYSDLLEGRRRCELGVGDADCARQLRLLPRLKAREQRNVVLPRSCSEVRVVDPIAHIVQIHLRRPEELESVTPERSHEPVVGASGPRVDAVIPSHRQLVDPPVVVVVDLLP